MPATKRAGRPARAAALHRDQPVVAYLTADESARLRVLAAEQGLSVSGLLRTLAIGLLAHRTAA